jgi:hypothetical protein
MIRTLGSAAVVSGTPTPVLFAAADSPFPKYSIASASLSKGLLTFTLTVALPANGFNGPNYQISGNPGSPANGQQVVLWGLGVYTDLNGKKVSIVRNDGNKSFTIAYGGVNSGTDTGSVAPIPFQTYRNIELTAASTIGSDVIYVGDNYVSSSRYMFALGAGQSTSLEGLNIPAELVCIDGTTSASDTVQVTLFY